uniref:Uncharacterized protein n=1 Tax=Noccaea caerulescens TaxID=107243 RepID=A0A1J3HDB1_NOCCA
MWVNVSYLGERRKKTISKHRHRSHIFNENLMFKHLVLRNYGDTKPEKLESEDLAIVLLMLCRYKKNKNNKSWKIRYGVFLLSVNKEDLATSVGLKE